jgi:hypothetical protein
LTTFEEWQTMWGTLAGVLLGPTLAGWVGYMSLGGGIERIQVKVFLIVILKGDGFVSPLI